MLKIKAEAVNNLSDARYFSSKGADWIGFCLDNESPDFVEPKDVLAMTQWLNGPKIVGELAELSVEDLKVTLKVLQLDMLQLHEPSDDILNSGIPLITKITPGSDLLDKVNAYKEKSELIILDFREAGISWTALKDSDLLEPTKSACGSGYVMINIDISREDVQEMIDGLNPYGLNIRSGKEISKGLRDFSEIDELIERLEA